MSSGATRPRWLKTRFPCGEWLALRVAGRRAHQLDTQGHAALGMCAVGLILDDHLTITPSSLSTRSVASTAAPQGAREGSVVGR